jgi:hypothetical protein
MTATLAPHEASARPAEQALRIPPIAVNLLPAEIVDARRTRRTRRIVIMALVVFVFALGDWYGLVAYGTATARGHLRAAQDDVRRIERQQQAYSKVVSTQTESKTIDTQLTTLLAEDLRWAKLLSVLRGAAPKGIALTAVSASLASTNGTAGGAQSVQLPSTTTARSIGTLTLSGTGPSKAVVASYVDILGTLPGLANPILGDATVQDGVLAFTVRLDVTDTALGGRYAKGVK